jgi:hypothetical protein
MTHKTINVPLSKLYLDNDNPRHNHIDNERDIIAELVKHEQIMPLARDIAEQQDTSPLDNIYVMQHETLKGAYVVHDGNRRVCALKLLADPDKAPTAKQRDQLRQWKAKAGRLPRSVEVVCETDPERVHFWKARKHEGQQGGVGQKNWGSQQKARHAERSGNKNQNALALALLDHAERSGWLTRDEREEVPVTTLTRYLRTQVVRDAIGISDPSELRIHVHESDFERAARTFLEDARRSPDDPLRLSSRTKTTERQAYGADLRTRAPATQRRPSSPHVPKPSTHKEPARKRAKVGSINRATIVNPDFKPRIHGQKLAYRFNELSKLPKEFPLAGAYLLRSFLEHLAHEYAHCFNLGRDGESHKVLGRCVAHLRQALEKDNSPNRVTNILKPLSRAVNQPDARGSFDELGASVHGSIVVTWTELKAVWDSFEECIDLMLNAIDGASGQKRRN